MHTGNLLYEAQRLGSPPSPAAVGARVPPEMSQEIRRMMGSPEGDGSGRVTHGVERRPGSQRRTGARRKERGGVQGLGKAPLRKAFRIQAVRLHLVRSVMAAAWQTEAAARSPREHRSAVPDVIQGPGLRGISPASARVERASHRGGPGPVGGSGTLGAGTGPAVGARAPRVVQRRWIVGLSRLRSPARPRAGLGMISLPSGPTRSPSVGRRGVRIESHG